MTIYINEKTRAIRLPLNTSSKRILHYDRHWHDGCLLREALVRRCYVHAVLASVGREERLAHEDSACKGSCSLEYFRDG